MMKILAVLLFLFNMSLAQGEQRVSSAELYFWAAGAEEEELEVATREFAAVNFVDNVVRGLLKGPTESESLRGLQAYFTPLALKGTSPGQDAKSLLEYYRGVKVKNGTAVLDFTEGAMRYLNNTIAIQRAVKLPISQTLIGISGIREVKFSIDGKVVEDFDA